MNIAITTGAGTGIGRSAAQHLAQDGWTVVAAGRRLEPLQETIASLEGDGHLAFPADVADPSDVDALFAATVKAFGRVDLLFNNAGVGAPPVPFDEISVEDWKRVVDINLTGSFLC
ncbi:MAG: SDR family NAD(P)-dependent oxidoreductase, partial [Acidimicrobiales bacterium]